jgi:hypothetical protein
MKERLQKRDKKERKARAAAQKERKVEKALGKLLAQHFFPLLKYGSRK